MPRFLADQSGPVAVRFETQHGVPLLGRIADVDALARLIAVWHPKESVQAHDVVETQNPGVTQVVAQVGSDIAVGPGTTCVGMQRRKAPILSAGKKIVGRRATRHSTDKKLAFLPHIIAPAVHPKGQVEIQPGPVLARLVGNCLHLLVGQPLDIAMIVRAVLGKPRLR